MTATAEDPAPSLVDRVDLRRALLGLQASDRALLWLRFAEDLAHRDVAACLGLTEVAVRIRLHRLRRRLREH